jgi:hypothetical protein
MNDKVKSRRPAERRLVSDFPDRSIEKKGLDGKSLHLFIPPARDFSQCP